MAVESPPGRLDGCTRFLDPAVCSVRIRQALHAPSPPFFERPICSPHAREGLVPVSLAFTNLQGGWGMSNSYLDAASPLDVSCIGIGPRGVPGRERDVMALGNRLP